MRSLIVNFILNQPKKAIGLYSLLLFLFLPGIFFLTSDFSYRAWYLKDDPLLLAYDKFEQRFGNDDSVIVSIYHPEGFYTKKALELVYDFTDEYWTIPNIVRVDSLTNYDYIQSIDNSLEVNPLVTEEERENITPELITEIKQAVQGKKQLENNYISSDGKMVIISGKVAPTLKQNTDNKETIDRIESLISKYEKLYPEFKFYTAGTATFINIFREISERDLMLLIPVLFIVFGILLYRIYSRPSGVFYPFLIIFTSVGIMVGISGFLGHPLTTLSSAAPSILITIAVADTIHILTVYFFAKRQNFSNYEAVKYSLTKNFLPTFLTSITTAIGFFSFTNSLILSISQMGIQVGFGVFFAWVSTYYLLGPLLILFPPIKDKQDGPTSPTSSMQEKEKGFIISQRTKSFVSFLYRAKPYILILTGFGILSSFYFAKDLEINLDPQKQFKDSHPYKVSFNKTEEHFGPFAQAEIMVDAGGAEQAKDPHFLRKVEQYESWLVSRDAIIKTVSILDIIKDVNKNIHNGDENYHRLPETSEAIAQNILFYSLGLPQGREVNNLISLNSDSVRIIANWNIQKSKEAFIEMNAMEKKAKELGLDAKVTGKMPLFHQLTPYVVKSFIQSFTFALIAITILLIIVLKSFKLGFMALIPNLLPILFGSGIYALSGEYIDISSVLIVAVCLGIAVDDSIHFLFEFQKFRTRGLSLRNTLEAIFTNTAPSLINTTLLIAIGFGSFILADYIPNAKFGVMVSLILILALIADLFILPIVLMYSEKED
ncbi:MAG: hypothetical protein CME62_05780 [Halobacteriovoraceae bacterium]|nr:hypothetical protein [Halobacteriovoraceae bacterium]|tara:strand:- start:18346 stop:20664 length:2319 start_codon:yes stop_codon:yes gene_type:complete